MWKSQADTKELIKSIENIEQLERLYSLSLFWKNAVYPEDYIASKEWVHYLTLSVSGEEIVNQIIEETGIAKDEYFFMSLFGRFFHHNLIFDHEKSNIDEIQRLLSQEILGEKITFPYRFGRLLYDRFNDYIKTNKTKHLLPEDTKTLLTGTPKGISQVSDIIIGPLGVLNSSVPRFVPPTLTLPLWHCSDTGCNAPHFVNLVPPVNGKLQDVYQQTETAVKKHYGPPSEWAPALKWIHRKGELEHWRSYSAIMELIAESLFGNERTALLACALKGESKNQLRELISSPPKKKSDGTGKPEEVAERLSAEEQLQLLMTLSDNQLIQYIDELTAANKIKIPIGEIRKAKFYYRGRSGDDICELSSFGIRSRIENPLINLTALIWNAYYSDGITQELEWKLREVNGRDARESLTIYAREYGPEKTVTDLILSISSVTKKICNDIKLSLDLIQGSNSKAVKRMLWKLGFAPNEYDDLLLRLKARLTSFNEKALSINKIDDESDREGIRSIGVNLFVSLEEYLDRLISYNVWLLSNDHFSESKFVYDIDIGRQRVRKYLSNSSDNSIEWSIKGDNSLGVLLYFLSELLTWLNNLEETSRDKLKRNEDDLPHYIHDELRPFPFRHMEFWADTDVREFSLYKDGLASIIRLINQSDLASIRNGIDHFRDEDSFPEIDKMIACATRLQQAVEMSDIGRYFPKSFSLTSERKDSFNGIEFTFEDYRGKEFKSFGPAVVSGLPKPKFGEPIVIAPCNLLGLPNSNLMFKIRISSEFSRHWENYPRRRKIVSVSETEQDEIHES
ncbi:hypothetical protein CWB85_10650 [Pseudoalteromonas sp. S1727]|uniref:hypothetical protein n=1 Tax=Pseudoalteromonas sp. S1727 TaxID=2066514 RepID=UPI00110934CF|nr:hypothetical protein [Pseudoalteromonas sp. S1727]TMN71556.1 hypothetical protein CWB85_10650 [Pseudoalteromonas sp. S1727]